MIKEDKDNTQYNKVLKLIFSKKLILSYTKEDEKLIKKLWDSYYRKRKGVSISSTELLASSLLWQYSKLNFLWGYNKKWTQKNLGGIFNVKPKTIGNKTPEISALLKIKNWDDRFCRKEISEENPFKKMVMLENRFIITREQAIEKGLPFIPLKKTKEDYYYDGLEYIGENDEKAIMCFKKALEIDSEYIDAYNGLGDVYFFKNLRKAKEYYEKAYELTKKHFKNKWPNKTEWGITENRQYLRAIHCYGLVLWREGRNDEAMELFKLMLKLNKNDNQGARYLVAALYEGIPWDKMKDFDEDNNGLEDLFKKQNKNHGFFKWDK